MEYHFSELTAETLTTLYSNYGFRAKDIGEFVGLSEDAIRLQLKKFAIPTNPREKEKQDILVFYEGHRKDQKSSLTQELLQELYCQQGMSDAKIGELFGITGEGVAYRRKKFGIQTKDGNDKRKEKNIQIGQKDLLDLTREELREEIKFAGGIKGVARKFHSTFKTVHTLICKEGLDRDTIIEHSIDLTELQYKLLVAGLLGDGGVYKGSLNTCFYKEAHCIQRLSYLKWKYDLMTDIVEGDLYFWTKTNPLGTKSRGATLRTKSIRELKELREIFYRDINGEPVKIIPRQIAETLDPFVFSVWFLDDGGLEDSGIIPYICTGAPLENVQEIAPILEDRFHLGIEVKDSESVRIMRFLNVENFIKVVSENIPKEFYYKIPVKYRFKIKGLSEDILKLEHALTTYTPDKWKILPAKEQQAWIENIAKYFEFIGFPYFRIPSGVEFSGEIKSLMSKDLTKDVKSSGIFLRPSSICSDIASSYFPHMWAAKVVGKHSVYNNYQDSLKFRRVIENVLKYRKILSEASIRAELRHTCTVQNFKPIIAKTIYDLYCPDGGTVFDFSAGWGGRLVGACASTKVSRYIGVDPCEQTFFSLRALSRRLDAHFPGKTVSILNGRAEDPDLYNEIDSVDMCFSSPPYFDAEKYSEEETQSYRMYPSIDMWVAGFLRKMIENSHRVLKDGGYFVINIADTRKIPLQKYTYDICTSLFTFEKVFLMVMPGYYGKEKYEPIFVFKKVSADTVPRPYELIEAEMNCLFESFRDEPVFDDVRGKNTLHREPLTIGDKEKSVEAMRKIYEKSTNSGREYIRGLSSIEFPFPVWVIERDFGSWNKFLRECGIQPTYEEKSPKERVRDFFIECKKAGRRLSFYEYNRLPNGNSGPLKRLFYTGHKYHSLYEELQRVCADEPLWDDFLNKLEG